MNSCFDLASCATPTNKTPLAGSNTIHQFDHSVCCRRPYSPYHTVYLVRRALFARAPRPTPPARAQPTTHIAVTSVRARTSSTTSLRFTTSHRPPLEESPAAFTQCASSSPTSSSCIHHLSHARNPFLSCNRTPNSFTAAITCAHFVYPHCNPKLPLHWPRWFASDTRTHLSPDSATFTKDDTRTPPLLSNHLAFASPLATIIWPSSR